MSDRGSVMGVPEAVCCPSVPPATRPEEGETGLRHQRALGRAQPDEAVGGQVGAVPGFPGRQLRLEGGVSGRDAARPVGHGRAWASVGAGPRPGLSPSASLAGFFACTMAACMRRKLVVNRTEISSKPAAWSPATYSLCERAPATQPTYEPRSARSARRGGPRPRCRSRRGGHLASTPALSRQRRSACRWTG